VASLRATDPFPEGLIRAFELLTTGDRPHQVLVWTDQSQVVIKDAATLSQPRDGVTRIPLADVSDVELVPGDLGSVLSLRTEHGVFRLRGTAAVIDGFVTELSSLNGFIRPAQPQPPQRFLRRLVARVRGI